MDTEAIRKKVQEVDPKRYQYLLDLEKEADFAFTEHAEGVTFVWSDAYGHTVEWGQAVGWHDAKAECLRRSMQDNGWIAGEHRFTPDTFVVVEGSHLADIVRSLVPMVRSKYTEIPAGT